MAAEQKSEQDKMEAVLKNMYEIPHALEWVVIRLLELHTSEFFGDFSLKFMKGDPGSGEIKASVLSPARERAARKKGER